MQCEALKGAICLGNILSRQQEWTIQKASIAPPYCNLSTLWSKFTHTLERLAIFGFIHVLSKCEWHLLYKLQNMLSEKGYNALEAPQLEEELMYWCNSSPNNVDPPTTNS